MKKIDLLCLLLNKPKGYQDIIKNYVAVTIREILGDAASQTEDGIRILLKSGHRWLKDLSNNIDEVPTVIKDGTALKGIRYRDGTEIGDGYYYIHKLNYRMPSNFLIDESGIHKNWYIDKKKGIVKGELITSTPIIAVGTLIVASGRFQSFYRFKDIITGSEFVDDLRKLTFVTKNKMPMFKEYVQSCVRYNTMLPTLIKVAKFN